MVLIKSTPTQWVNDCLNGNSVSPLWAAVYNRLQSTAAHFVVPLSGMVDIDSVAFDWETLPGVTVIDDPPEMSGPALVSVSSTTTLLLIIWTVPEGRACAFAFHHPCYSRLSVAERGKLLEAQGTPQLEVVYCDYLVRLLSSAPQLGRSPLDLGQHVVPDLLHKIGRRDKYGS